LYRGIEGKLSVAAAGASRALDLLSERLVAAGCETNFDGDGKLEFRGTRIVWSEARRPSMLDRAWPFVRHSTKGVVSIEERSGTQMVHYDIHAHGLAMAAIVLTFFSGVFAPFLLPLFGLDAAYAFSIGFFTLFGGWGLFYETPRYRMADDIRTFVLRTIMEAEKSSPS